MPVSPPRSAKLPQAQISNSFLSNRDDFSLSATVANDFEDSKHDLNDHSHYQLTPLSSPTIDHNSGHRQASFNSTNDHISSSYFGHQLGNEALSALQTPPPSHRLPIAAWGPDATENFDFNLPASPDFSQSQKPQAWWPSSSAPQPSPAAYHSSRTESSGMGFDSVPASGLGISCDLSGFGEPGASASAYAVPATQLYTYANPMPPAHTYIATTPPSRSPSSSPPPHRVSNQRTSSRHRQHSGPHHRRKSSNSSNSAPRPASVGFVNFTPDDSRKILTGVAPSGSSKTKARREKEAAERRRKLSQAATRAIIDAGGDLAELEREGLLCLAAEE
ncbi:uncharacterized protein BDZ99DRAFT_460919 [Mytilinidion resinicola]|uniref:Developmental regulatory protein wetA n=1 Tax=Mytilinidion resinicola TaxID=574789 RepID=A0A6A6YT66_9PEZI|nr:uncharacterized protein BDZ99DRAFT_460919 [Mytilinidion resinicola]KAF2812146.1 hypothetical protein BDZ99DRAFT_460919 [Mytilinidion resinicola]